jgi:hypothetical protein
MTVLQFRRRVVQEVREVPQHWLIFNVRREVTGCACGFQADVEQDFGYGDSVVDHLLGISATEAVGSVRDNEASPQGAPTPAGSDRQPMPGRG